MVESNIVLTTSTDTEDVSFRPSPKISKEKATANLTFLRTQAESWLAVLFNVFSSVNKNARGMVGDVISVWASITEQQVRLTTLLGIYKLISSHPGPNQSISKTYQYTQSEFGEPKQ